MAQKVVKVTAMSTQAPDQPGTAAGMANALRERGINLKAIWAWSSGGGMTTVAAIPERPEELRKLAADEGQAIQEMAIAWLEGADEVGAMCSFLDKVAGAGINIASMHAVAVGGHFAAAFSFADEKTVDRVVALMGG